MASEAPPFVLSPYELEVDAMLEAMAAQGEHPGDSLVQTGAGEKKRTALRTDSGGKINIEHAKEQLPLYECPRDGRTLISPTLLLCENGEWMRVSGPVDAVQVIRIPAGGLELYIKESFAAGEKACMLMPRTEVPSLRNHPASSSVGAVKSSHH